MIHIKKSVAFIALCTMLTTGGVFAQTRCKETDRIPERAIILCGDSTTQGLADHIAILYSRENLSFNDPGTPRFLFFDRKGKVALGIGGYVKATGMYDFDGAIDGNGFETYDIAVPADPSLRNRFGADASNSTIFLKLVTHPTRLGRIIVYIQTNFSGDNGNYGLKLKQAYVNLGNITAGMTHSVFSDPESQAPTIDTQGPSGQIDKTSIMFKYCAALGRGFSAGASIEAPSSGFRLSDNEKSIAQRCPDIPAYIQYSWDKNNSHVRVAGIFRSMSYRDLTTNTNHSVSGWGVHISTVARIIDNIQLFGHYAYGKGIGSYINDLADYDFNLVPAEKTGRMTAPAMSGLTAGMMCQVTPKLMVSANYSTSRLYDCSGLGEDTYRYGQYVTGNVYYNITEDFKVGAEYVYGSRKDYNGLHGKANRLEAMLQYSF